MGRRILFVHGLDPTVSAKELAREFERIGPVRRCDIPPFSSRSDSIYGFVEMESSRDADIAYRELHGRRFLGGSIKVQWAKSVKRRDGPGVGGGRRRRSASPMRGRSRSPVAARMPSRSPSPPAPSSNAAQQSVGDLNWDVNNNNNNGGNFNGASGFENVTANDIISVQEENASAGQPEEDHQAMEGQEVQEHEKQQEPEQSPTEPQDEQQEQAEAEQQQQNDE